MALRDDYQKLVMNGKPVGYWPLRENADDVSGRDNHGEEYGSPEFIHDDSGGWVRLDGKSYLEVSSQPVFSQPASEFGLTVEVWMQAHSLHYPTPETYIHWLGKGESGKHEWAFRLYSDDSKRSSRLSAYIWNKEGGEGAGAHLKCGISCNRWMHLMACFEPGSAARLSVVSSSPRTANSSKVHRRQQRFTNTRLVGASHLKQARHH